MIVAHSLVVKQSPWIAETTYMFIACNYGNFTCNHQIVNSKLYKTWCVTHCTGSVCILSLLRHNTLTKWTVNIVTEWYSHGDISSSPLRVGSTTWSWGIHMVVDNLGRYDVPPSTSIRCTVTTISIIVIINCTESLSIQWVSRKRISRSNVSISFTLCS